MPTAHGRLPDASDPLGGRRPWFDPECPNAIVRERVCHSFCLDSTVACCAEAVRYRPAGRMFGFAVAGGSRGGNTVAPSRVCTGNRCDHG